MISIEITEVDSTNPDFKVRKRNLHAIRGEILWRLRLNDEKMEFDDEKEVTDSELIVYVDKFMEAGYTRATLFLEDCILVIPEPGTLIGFDVVTGHRESSIGVHALNIVAVVSLALSGDEHPDARVWYPLAEEAIKGWANECRPIP